MIRSTSTKLWLPADEYADEWTPYASEAEKFRTMSAAKASITVMNQCIENCRGDDDMPYNGPFVIYEYIIDTLDTTAVKNLYIYENKKTKLLTDDDIETLFKQG